MPRYGHLKSSGANPDAIPDAGRIEEAPTEGGMRTGLPHTVRWPVVLLAAAVPVHASSWTSAWGLQTIIGVVATILAFTIGAIALVGFYSRQRGIYLYIGTGFLGTGVLDAYHALITSPLLSGYFANTPAELIDLSAWSWTASRLFLSLFIYVSWLAWRKERVGQGALAVAGAGRLRHGVAPHHDHSGLLHGDSGLRRVLSRFLRSTAPRSSSRPSSSSWASGDTGPRRPGKRTPSSIGSSSPSRSVP